MCAVAFKPVIGIVRQWQPDCYHTPFVATQHLCNLLPQITFTIYLPLPLFFIALDYRIYLSDRKLFKIVRLPKQKQPRNFLTESENGISRKSFLNFRIKFPTLSCKLKKKKKKGKTNRLIETGIARFVGKGSNTHPHVPQRLFSRNGIGGAGELDRADRGGFERLFGVAKTVNRSRYLSFPSPRFGART